VDDVPGRGGAVPSQETSLAPGPHTQLPTDQAAPTVRNAVAQAADTPVDHHTHPASPAAPDAAQLSASLKPDSTDQPDTSKGLVPLCSGKNNATAAAATDGQQAPLPVSALRQHSRKRPIETDSVCTASQADTASPAPNRSHGARKQKSRKPAPSFQPGAEAGDVTADVSTAQQSQLKPTAPAEPSAEPSAEPLAEPSAEPLDEPSAEPLPEPSAEPSSEPSAEPSSQPQLSPQPQQWVEPDPADHPHALLPVSHEASAQKQSQPDPQPEPQAVQQANHDAQPQTESQLEPEAPAEPISTQVLAPDSPHALLQSQAESQLEPESHERVSTQVLPPDSPHALLQSQAEGQLEPESHERVSIQVLPQDSPHALPQSQLHSVPEAASLAVAPGAISHSQQQPQLWCCTWPQLVQQTPSQPQPPGQSEHEPKRVTRRAPWVRPKSQPYAVVYDCQGLKLLPTEAQLHCERLVASQARGSTSGAVADYPDLNFGSVEGTHLAAEWRNACDARLSSYGTNSNKLMEVQCLTVLILSLGALTIHQLCTQGPPIPIFACACQCLGFCDGARRIAAQLSV